MKDKWKAKEWYKLLAPEMFNEVVLGETPADSSEKVLGRTAELTVGDITGDFSKMHIKMKFKVYDVSGFTARTKFVEQSLTSDYLRRLVRRKRSKIDGVFDVKTKEGYVLRVKPVAVTDHRIQSSQKRAIRKIMLEECASYAGSHTMSEFIKGMISGDIQKRIARKSKVIYPLKRVEFRKIEVLKEPSEKDLERIREEMAKKLEEEKEAAEKEAEEAAGAGGEGAEGKAETGAEKHGETEGAAEKPAEEMDEKAVIKELTKIPGVGPQKAKLLYEAGYRSVDAVKNASPEELEVIDGIGPEMAKKIVENAKKV